MRSLVLAPMLALVLLAASTAARADVVFTEPCPPGARERTSHAGPRCEPWPCTLDVECGTSCRPYRVCTQLHAIPIAGLDGFQDPPAAPQQVVLVVGSCEPNESCTGAELPRPPISGDPIGEVHCAVARYCAAPTAASVAAPPVEPVAPPPPPPVSPSPPAPPSAATSANPPAPTADTTPRAGSCASRAARGTEGSAWLLALAGLSVLVLRRRALAALVVLLGTLALTPPARADAVFTEPCPSGAREATSHAGPRCDPWTCTADAECGTGRVCRPFRVCAQLHSIPAAGRGAFRDPPPPPSERALVVGSCEPSESCTGAEAPRPPLTGRPIGEVRCAVASYCARPVLPSLATAPLEAPPPAAPPLPAPSAPDPSTPALATPPSAAPRANTPAPAAVPSASSCACRASRVTAGSVWLGALGMIGLLVLARRRRAAVPASLVLFATAVFSTSLCSTVTAQQRVALPSPWIETQITPAPLFQTTALVCGRERAYARDFEGRIMEWDGQAWLELPPIPLAARRGRHLWVSESGHVFADAGGELARWDGQRWQSFPIDAYFQPDPAQRQPDLDGISGLGDAPWLLGRGAIGLLVGGRMQPFDAGGAWWTLSEVLPFSRTDVLLAGRGGLMRFDGARWAREPIPEARDYTDLLALARDDVWAVGPESALHWDGRSWTEQGASIAFPPHSRRHRQGLPSIGGRAGALYLATSTDVYHLDGTSWTRVLDSTMRSPFAYFYGPVCATARQVLVGEGAHVLVRPL